MEGEISEDRLSRFEWSGKEAKIKLSQCHNCDNTPDGISCEVFNKIPIKYQSNSEKCLSHSKYTKK